MYTYTYLYHYFYIDIYTTLAAHCSHFHMAGSIEVQNGCTSTAIWRLLEELLRLHTHTHTLTHACILIKMNVKRLFVIAYAIIFAAYIHYIGIIYAYGSVMQTL